MITGNDIIDRLKLQPHPEGGFFAETYRSNEQFDGQSLSSRYTSKRSIATAIYFLITAESCSVMHRLKSDEIFHFYMGDPVTMLHLYPDGSSRILTLGTDLINGQQPQVVVPKDTWQGSFVSPGGHCPVGNHRRSRVRFCRFRVWPTQRPDRTISRPRKPSSASRENNHL